MTFVPLLFSLAHRFPGTWTSLTAPRAQPTSDLEAYLSRAVDMHHLESLERNWERCKPASASRGDSC